MTYLDPEKDHARMIDLSPKKDLVQIFDHNPRRSIFNDLSQSGEGPCSDFDHDLEKDHVE